MFLFIKKITLLHRKKPEKNQLTLVKINSSKVLIDVSLIITEHDSI